MVTNKVIPDTDYTMTPCIQKVLYNSTVPRERFDSSVIMPFSWLLWLSVHIQCQVSIYIPFVVSQAFMAGSASQAGDTDSSRAPGLTSGLQGSVNVHRGALLLVPQ